MAEKKVYLIAVYPDEKGCFMATFPDFPELAADYGMSFEDCIHQAAAFLDAVAEDMVKNHQQLPIPSTVEEIKAKLDPAHGEPLCIVPVTVYPPAQTQRINITGKSNIFKRIDDFARQRHMTRSELMINATLDYIHANS